MKHSCLAGFLALGLVAPALAAVTYSDGTFASGTWVIELIQENGGGGASAVQSAGTGNPGDARRVTTTVNAGSPDLPSTVWAFQRYGTNVATRYEPATQGPIGAIAFSIDYRLVSGFGDGQGLAVGLKQGQMVYAAAYTVTGSSGQWGEHMVTGLRASDFSLVGGGDGEPDFSAGGAPIRFGFITSNSTRGELGYSITVDYDNFFVRVTAPCAADFNDDGGVDGADVEAFFAEWERGGSRGDVNSDGGVDGSDVEAFFALWEAGGCD